MTKGEARYQAGEYDLLLVGNMAVTQNELQPK